MIIKKYDSYVHIDKSEGEQWSQLAIKVLQQENKNEIVSPRIVSFNGEERIVFSIDGLVRENSASSSNEHKRRMIEVFVDLIRYVDSSEFLKRNNILLGVDMVYWKPKDDAPRFIIVPIECEQQLKIGERRNCWENDFLLFVRTYMDFSNTGNDHVIARIKELCETERIDKIDEIIQLMESIVSKTDRASENIVDKAMPMGTVVLKYQGEYGHFVLYDNEPVYKIGKSDNCQGVIGFNPTVSREHCVIEHYENGYYIIDLNSSNGTYLNGERLDPDIKMRISDGDTVVISNMKFMVVIEH